MSEKGTSVAGYVHRFDLEILNQSPTFPLDMLTVTNVNRPDLPILGLFDYFDPRRLQILGKTELIYLSRLEPEKRQKIFDDLLRYDIPALVLCRGMECPEACMDAARRCGRTLLRTHQTTADFITKTIDYLNRELAPCVTRHGVLLDIYGEGVMIIGDSGVGKSEAAIELIMRGHRLVADDAVEIRSISDQLVGTAPEVIRNYIELRGIGVIDIRQLFGMKAVKPEAQIDLIVEFEPWDGGKFYDRLGLEDRFTEILDHKVASVTIPIRPGRNLASIVEVAAMNNRHRRYGYNAAEELARKVDFRADQGSGSVPPPEKRGE